jgi:RsiG-like
VSHTDRRVDVSVDPLTAIDLKRAELEQLEIEEREISAIRRKMHERIDRGFPTELLIQQEEKLSKERRALHVRIDTLRAELELLERSA